MRLLLYNPNISSEFTGELSRALEPHLSRKDWLDTATAPKGPSFIGSAETIAAARDQLAEDLPLRAAGCDVVLLGCFGDLGLEPIRRRVAIPVITLSDVCFALAPALGPAAIVTTSPFWAERLGEDVRRRGLGIAIPAVRAIDRIIPFSRDRARDECRQAILRVAAEQSARIIVLGGAVLADLRDALLPASPLPVVDLIGAAVAFCRTLTAGSISVHGRNAATVSP